MNELNTAQQNAVDYCDGPSLVIAGAGSGKTRVLTYKIAHLLEHGMYPGHILALTFTNKAAREMRERIGILVGEELSRGLWMGTFHSVFSRILRREAHLLGFNSDFTIYDANDSKTLVKHVIKDMGLDDKTYKPSTVISHISMAKNALVLPAGYGQISEFARRDHTNRMPATMQIYQKYMDKCFQANVMDFDDLLLYTFLLFERFPEVRDHYQDLFQYVLVDEYQDTNYAQHRIVWQLTERRQRVCVVGDDAQSIYSFRGANIDNILRFQTLYKGARLFKLEQNYRSTQTIVTAANSLIFHNRNQIRKEVFSCGEKGAPIDVRVTYSDVDEANFVARRIDSFVRYDHISSDQIAILYRTNAQSRCFEEAFRNYRIPYRIYGGQSFYQRKEIKDSIAYFRLVVNPHDEEALRRVINYPARGIGETTVTKIFQTADSEKVSVWDTLHHADALPVNNGTRKKLADFVTLIESLSALVKSQDAYTLGMEILLRSSLRAEIMKGTDPDDISRQENLQELVNSISSFVDERTEQNLPCTLSDYLQEVSLLTDQDENIDDDTKRVTLMTIHASKGLEFQCIFVVGMEEDLFPSSMCIESPRLLEEERRLFYVAMTRAKERLILTWARSRMRYGKTESCGPSRFLREIAPQCLSNGLSSTPAISTSPHIFEERKFIPEKEGRASFYSKSTEQPSTVKRLIPVRHVSAALSGENNSDLQPGQHVVHARFGKGTVIEIQGTGLDAKAVINFENLGQKVLLLRFAKFEN